MDLKSIGNIAEQLPKCSGTVRNTCSIIYDNHIGLFIDIRASQYTAVVCSRCMLIFIKYCTCRQMS